MADITINTELCKKDGLCAMTCMRGIFRQDGKGTIPTIVDAESCFRCGQCVSICPQGAISHSDYPEDAVNPVKSELLPTYDHVLELVRSRRSRRAFKAKTVEREVIEKVLEAARFAPSEHNVQSTEFVVVQDEATIREIATLTAQYYASLARRLRSPIGRAAFRLMAGSRSTQFILERLPEMEGLVSLFNSGTDWILREAPVVVFFCADSAGGFQTVNATLSLYNAALAAETIGLGCFYAGFVVRACGRDASIARLVGLPETHKIYGALAMGYPRLRFRKWPQRNPARVRWVGSD